MFHFPLCHLLLHRFVDECTKIAKVATNFQFTAIYVVKLPPTVRCRERMSLEIKCDLLRRPGSPFVVRNRCRLWVPPSVEPKVGIGETKKSKSDRPMTACLHCKYPKPTFGHRHTHTHTKELERWKWIIKWVSYTTLVRSLSPALSRSDGSPSIEQQTNERRLIQSVSRTLCRSRHYDSSQLSFLPSFLSSFSPELPCFFSFALRYLLL